jgi:signal transduction histidine kinase
MKEIVPSDQAAVNPTATSAAESGDALWRPFGLCREGVLVIESPSGRVIRANRAVHTLLKRVKADLLQKTVPSLLAAEDHTAWQRLSARCQSEGVATAVLAWLSVQKERLLLDTTLVQMDFAGAIGILLILRDDPQQSTFKRERLLESRLQQAQKMEAVGTLASGIAHDFNNILFPVIGYTELVMEEMPPGSQARSNLQQVLQAAERAKELVRQILAFSREGGQSDKRPVRFEKILKEALKLLRATLPATIAIEQAIDENCGMVMADPTQLHQVVMNICTNAYGAMRLQGGQLKVSLKKASIGADDIGVNLALEPGPHLRLSIADSGRGMEPWVLERIFEPYFTTKSPSEGTGMGLFITHGIIRNHGGDIRVYSEPAVGTTVTIYLPLADSSADIRPHPSIEPIVGGNERILLVDDEETIVRMQKQILTRLGYRVTATLSSLEALDIFRERPGDFDLVITDQTMPNLTGAQLAAKILEIAPSTPVVLCTGFSEVITEKKAKHIGIRQFVMKPVVTRELAATIREVLAG